MAIAPTGDVYKSLTFDGKTSRSYGVYITGEAVYNAPERDVEMITIPGRSGSFALDNGRFENITVTYPAGIFAETEADFRAAISDFRNFLCSRKGYVRLQDEYNPNEYRMAVYKSGLEVEPAMLKAGEFEITFDCKPQRWLTSGETKQTIANSGDTITNPTLFEAGPLLEVEGYGNIGVNDKTITLENIYMGDVKVGNGFTGSLRFTATANIEDTQALDVSALNSGDVITFSGIKVVAQAKIMQGTYQYASANITSTSNCSATLSIDAAGRITVNIALEPFQVLEGTYDSMEYSVTFTGTTSETPPQTTTHTLNIDIFYDGTDNTVSYSREFTNNFNQGTRHTQVVVPDIYGASTQSALGTPTYIDCDIGDAYKIEGGTVISLNHVIDLGSKLPTLAPGANTITFDNTVTDMKVVPRWWKV